MPENKNDTGTNQDPQPIACDDAPGSHAFIAREPTPPPPDAPCWVCGRLLADGDHEHGS